jgi:hypothetical protein
MIQPYEDELGNSIQCRRGTYDNGYDTRVGSEECLMDCPRLIKFPTPGCMICSGIWTTRDEQNLIDRWRK